MNKRSYIWQFVFRAIQIILTTSFMGAGCSRKPETLTNKYDEKKMDQAIAEARSTLDEFLSRLRSPQPGDEHFHVKVRIEDKNGVEHFWVSDPKLDSEPYSGKIADEPGIVSKVKFGQEYYFTRSEISDWMYMANGKMQGNYTLRVELESMPPREADALKKKIGW
jgi:uncharacterized protein YegJ (DUF2314 family)